MTVCFRKKNSLQGLNKNTNRIFIEGKATKSQGENADSVVHSENTKSTSDGLPDTDDTTFSLFYLKNRSYSVYCYRINDKFVLHTSLKEKFTRKVAFSIFNCYSVSCF